MSYSYPIIIIDLVCTDARETNWPGLPFTDTSDGNYLVNPGDADAGYITAGGSFFDGGSTSSVNKIYYYEYLEDIE